MEHITIDFIKKYLKKLKVKINKIDKSYNVFIIDLSSFYYDGMRRVNYTIIQEYGEELRICEIISKNNYRLKNNDYRVFYDKRYKYYQEYGSNKLFLDIWFKTKKQAIRYEKQKVKSYIKKYKEQLQKEKGLLKMLISMEKEYDIYAY
jgi:hypothetical protein